MKKNEAIVRVGVYKGLSEVQKTINEGVLVRTWIDRICGLKSGVRR